MDCNTALIALSAQLDGELSPQEERRLEAHLVTCPHCRALRQQLAAVHTLCAEEIPAPPQLKASVMASLPPQAAPKRSKVIPLPWRRLAAAAACLTLVFLAVWRFSVSTPDASRPDVTLERSSPAPSPLPAQTETAVTAGISSDNDQAPLVASAPISSNTEVFQNNDAPLTDCPVEDGASDVVADPEPVKAASMESDKKTVDTAPLPDTSVATDAAPDAGAGASSSAGSEDLSLIGTTSTDGQAAPHSSVLFRGAFAKLDAVSADELTPENRMEDLLPPVSASPEDAVLSAEASPSSPADTLVATANDALFREVVLATATDVTYVGAVAVDSAPDGLLQSYRYRDLEDGSVLYRMPSKQFQSLLDELTDGQALYGRSDDGYCAASDGQYGLLVIVHPFS